MPLPMTTRQIALRAGVSTQAVIGWINDGRLVPTGRLPGINGAYLFDPVTVETFLENRNTGGNTHD